MASPFQRRIFPQVRGCFTAPHDLGQYDNWRDCVKAEDNYLHWKNQQPESRLESGAVTESKEVRDQRRRMVLDFERAEEEYETQRKEMERSNKARKTRLNRIKEEQNEKWYESCMIQRNIYKLQSERNQLNTSKTSVREKNRLNSDIESDQYRLRLLDQNMEQIDRKYNPQQYEDFGGLDDDYKAPGRCAKDLQEERNLLLNNQIARQQEIDRLDNLEKWRSSEEGWMQIRQEEADREYEHKQQVNRGIDKFIDNTENFAQQFQNNRYRNGGIKGSPDFKGNTPGKKMMDMLQEWEGLDGGNTSSDYYLDFENPLDGSKIRKVTGRAPRRGNCDKKKDGFSCGHGDEITQMLNNALDRY